jgi:hypothetical protein
MAPLVVALATIAGCGAGTKVLDVEGTVTLDGKPLAEGDISFIPLDKTQGGEGGKIKDGKYRMNAKPGTNRVEIRAVREVPGKKMPSAAGPGAPAEAVMEQAVGPDYNEKSKLQAEVEAGKTTHNFEVKSP